jgi:hypothetical protein
VRQVSPSLLQSFLRTRLSECPDSARESERWNFNARNIPHYSLIICAYVIGPRVFAQRNQSVNNAPTVAISPKLHDRVLSDGAPAENLQLDSKPTHILKRLIDSRNSTVTATEQMNFDDVLRFYASFAAPLAPTEMLQAMLDDNYYEAQEIAAEGVDTPAHEAYARSLPHRSELPECHI